MKIAFLHRFEHAVRMWVKNLYSGGINRTWAEDIYKKAEGLRRGQGDIQLLALGSSHGAFGFKAQVGEFNLCTASQDLYYSWKLYELLAPTLPQVKTVLLFYSVFSPGFELERTGEVARCDYYFSILGIPFKTERIQHEKCPKNMRARWERYVRKNPFTVPQEYRGNDSLQKIMKLSLEERVQAHLKHNQRNNGQTRFVEKMKAFAEQTGQRLVVVIPPFRLDYREKAGSFETLFKELKAIEGLELLSYYQDDTFLATDFVDMDHLNDAGAVKLSQKIRLFLTGARNEYDKIS